MSESTATIDDLFFHGEESEPEAAARPRSGGVRWWVRTIAGAGVLGGVTVVGIRVFGFEVSIPLALCGWFALLSLHRLVAQVSVPTPRRGRTPPDAGDYETTGYDPAALDSLRTAVRWWEERLEAANRNPDRFRGALLPALRELADERLRQRHGFTVESDPKRARALFGEPLWKVLTTPNKRTPAPRDLVAAVADLERI